MVVILELKNSELGTRADFNEIVLIDCIKLAHHRNIKLKKVLIDIYEQVFKKKFDEELMKY